MECFQSIHHHHHHHRRRRRRRRRRPPEVAGVASLPTRKLSVDCHATHQLIFSESRQIRNNYNCTEKPRSSLKQNSHTHTFSQEDSKSPTKLGTYLLSPSKQHFNTQSSTRAEKQRNTIPGGIFHACHGISILLLGSVSVAGLFIRCSIRCSFIAKSPQIIISVQ